MNYLKLLFACSLFSAGFSALATYNVNACDTTITRVTATSQGGGRVLIIPNEASLSNLNCTPPEGRYVTLAKSHPLFSEIYSMALTAVTTNAEVRLRIHEDTALCEINYMWIKSSSDN